MTKIQLLPAPQQISMRRNETHARSMVPYHVAAPRGVHTRRARVPHSRRRARAHRTRSGSPANRFQLYQLDKNALIDANPQASQMRHCRLPNGALSTGETGLR
ncbi:hypothetical protein RI054_16g75360 [Pseudoscourfieldia marina]